MKKSAILFLSFLLFQMTAYSQSGVQTVHGTVTDASTGIPIPGANVLEQGTTNGTVTDFNGNYSIEVPVEEGVLVFSFIGMETKEVNIEGRTEMNVELETSTESLQEVLVVAYGTQRKKNVTGSISTISAEEIEDMPVANFAQKIQGRIAGVQVNQVTGRPGGGMDFRIRGAASIGAGNDPLFVIDGQPIVGNINISPNEIETFTVLKDASATSLYGSRGANGVILITTKKGKGKTRIELNSYYGIQQVPQRGRPDVMNAREFAQFQKEFYLDKTRYENWINPVTGTAEVPEEYQNPERYGEGTNWFNTLIRDAPIQNHTLSVSSGGKRLSTYVSMDYFNQEGVIVNSGYERFSLRMNNEFIVNDALTVGMSVAPNLELNHNTRTNTDGTWQIIQAAVLTSPLAPAVNLDGTLPLTATSTGMFPNPNWYRVMMERNDDYQSVRLLSNAYAELEPFEGLQLRTQFSVDMAGENHKNFVPSTSVGQLFVAPPQRATGYYNHYNYFSWLSENTATYKDTIGTNHAFELLAGYTAQEFRSEHATISGTDYPSDLIPWLNAAETTDGTSGMSEWSLLSMISRLNYNYKGKYLLSAAVRRDGSSRFGRERRWGVFPSVSVGWIVSDEPFFEDLSDDINFLKIRSSYGITGNNNIGNYSAIGLLGNTNYVFGGQLAPGKSIFTLGNNLLSWEKTSQLDVGFDAGLFNNRLNITYDYYQKETDGLLYHIALPRASGFSSVQSNIGAFEFWGHEFSLNSTNLTGELSWETNFNISFHRNKVVQLGTNNTPIGGYGEYSDYWRTAVGHPIGLFYGYVFDGVYMTQEEFESQPKHATSAVGTVRMKDLNGDGVIDINDRTFIGNPNPDFLYGFVNDFSYKKFDLSITISGAVGGDVWNGYQEFTENLDGVFNVRKIVADRWRSEENPGNGIIPRTLAGTTALFRAGNSRNVYDGSYLTIKNITLGFSPALDFDFLRNLRIYGSIQQALVITNYPGGNPEVSSAGLNALNQGVDTGAYPVPRTLVIGINASF